MTTAAAIAAAVAVIVFLVWTNRKMARGETPTQHGPFWDMFDPARPAQPPVLEEPDERH